MHVATHLIKIEGRFDNDIWTKDKLEKYVRSKIEYDIEKFFHADLELFGIDDEIINVWIYISALPSEVSKDIVSKWLSNHIKEEGITVTCFNIEERFNRLNQEEIFVTLV
jgi:hypothetical protein